MSTDVIEQGATRRARASNAPATRSARANWWVDQWKQDASRPPRKSTPLPWIEPDEQFPRYPKGAPGRQPKPAPGQYPQRTIKPGDRIFWPGERNPGADPRKTFRRGDRKPFGRRLRGLPDTGRMIPRIPVPWLAPLFVGGLWDDFNDWLPSDHPEGDTWPDNFIPLGWALERQCVPQVRVNGCNGKQANCQTSNNCLSGQAGTVFPLPVELAPNIHRFRLVRQYRTVTGVLRYKNDRWLRRSPCPPVSAPATTIWGPSEIVSIAPHPMRNPNVMRRLPTAKPAPDPGGGLRVNPFPIVPRTIKNIAKVYDPKRGGWQPIKPNGRKPPRTKREKEKKGLSGKLRQGLLRGADAISEMSEIVDALYNALPEAVRRRWEGKARWYEYDNIAHRGEQGLTDNAKRYGIDGADWKLRAVWNNFDKINWDQAMGDIAVNIFVDQLVGGAMGEASKKGIHGV